MKVYIQSNERQLSAAKVSKNTFENSIKISQWSDLKIWKHDKAHLDPDIFREVIA